MNHFHQLASHSSSEYQPVGILDMNNTVCGEDIVPPEQPKYKNLKSLHGYHQSNVDEMNGFMVCIGHQIEDSKIIEQTHIENIAPTLARLFKISHQCDGKNINELIRGHA